MLSQMQYRLQRIKHLPALVANDGQVYSQSTPILRFICATNTGRNGEVLYPGAKDPFLSYKIDKIVDDVEDL